MADLDELVQRAARVALARQHGVADYEPNPWELAPFRALADAGLLADQSALLSRLADLTEVAGKQRSTEWLRTCATLPPAEWPSAPAYKGPMVPAADRDTLSLMLRAMARKLVAYRRWADGDVPMVHVLRAEVEEFKLDAGRNAAAVTQARAERDALQARLDEIRTVLAEDAETRARFQVDTSTSYGPRFLSRIREIVERGGVALQGDQPTERETRCMNGPAKQHTLRMVEILKALKAASADGALPGELDDQASFTQLARAIVDHWPTGEVDRG